MSDQNAPQKPGGRRRLSAEERQQEIMEAALDLVAESDVDAVTTQDMATRIGLTQGAIFRHFASKEAIWEALVRWLQRRLTKVLSEAAQGGRDPLDALERTFFAHLDFIAKHPGLPKLIFSDQLLRKNPRLKGLVQEILRAYEGSIAGLIAESQRQGLSPRNLDPEAAAVLFVGMIQGLVVQSTVLGYRNSLGAEARSIFTLYLNGIRTRPAEDGEPCAGA
ncbi:TetR/AcrR family transcriptional regulator [Thermithiobacillus tepidarius DSM 3134]|uniref:TetR/AcrR family transcriptional regulator n=1 Tax=Thermithiobacillus tepidarius TaxID=929 RepID=UPI0004202C6A|nr:TetR/AcrR family transcriptional regulator [Thermithiobacillus tepidarius]